MTPKKKPRPTRAELNLPAELLELIDAERGDVSRNRWIVRTLANWLGRPGLARKLGTPGKQKGRKKAHND